jgi:hypothetical protein
MSILPGVREFRVPLASGVIWLLTAWILFEPAFSEDTPTGVLKSLTRLGGFFGTAGITAAVLFVAYLTGIILAFYRLPMHRVWGRRENGTPVAIKALDRTTLVDLSSFVRELVERASELLINGGTWGGEPWTEESVRDLRGALNGPLVDSIVLEEKTLAMRLRLQDKGVSIFQSYDAKTAEAQFRQGVAFPIVALLVTLAFTASWFWLFGLAIPVSLLVLAYYSRKEATAELCQALVHGLITSTSITTFQEAVNEQDLDALHGRIFWKHRGVYQVRNTRSVADTTSQRPVSRRVDAAPVASKSRSTRSNGIDGSR